MYTGCVYICVWEAGRCGVGWGGIVMWVCKQEIDVRVCACLNSCIFNLSKLTRILAVCIYIYIYAIL